MICSRCGYQYAHGETCPLCSGEMDCWELQFSPVPLPKIGEQIGAWLGQLPHPAAIEIAAMSGATERTFWNRIKRDETWARLTGLVTPIAADVKEWAAGPTLRRLPRRYSVAMTLPLTAADVRSLTAWIAGHIEQHGGPEGMVAAACETPVETLIPPDAPTPEDGQPQTVRQVVRDLFNGELPDEKLDALAERMQMHLMPPGDLLVITHFFIEHILPWLGTGPGWMLTILRDRCFVDPESGVTRNQVSVRGGYAEIAGGLGLSRVRTVYDWLRDPIVLGF